MRDVDIAARIDAAEPGVPSDDPQGTWGLPPSLAGAVAGLAHRDPDFARIARETPPYPFQDRGSGFAAVLDIILGQQVSTAAGRAMREKLARACPDLTPATFLDLDEAVLKGCGFSRMKMAYGRGLAEAIAAGRLDLEAVGRLEDDGAVVAALTALKGIGRWTAEVYMLFGLHRPDVWPAGDLGVRVGIQLIKGLDDRPSPKDLDALAEPWRPWRSGAALLAWRAYRAYKRGDFAM